MEEEIKQDNVQQAEAQAEEIIKEDIQENIESEAKTDEGNVKTEKGFLGKKKKNSEIEKLQKKIDELTNENKEQTDKYARLAAEYDNYRKRTAKEIDMRYSDAKADVWRNIISIVDDFERVIKTDIPTECQNYKEGVNLIYKKLTEMMTAAGIEEIKALNEQFDPELHNAVMHVESEEAGENEIVEVFMKGYKLGDKVIRFSMVKVAN
ncbi:MAG: nucleotide exchange factor GrpE [Clostridia bacterium]|nr:nucleotide exchange factor GrpE [Clostridia bacterium]